MRHDRTTAPPGDHAMPLRVVVGLVHPRGGDEPGVLLFRRSRRKNVEFPGQWCFPGGKVENSETDAEALKRELHEEVALQVLVSRRLDMLPILFEPPLVKRAAALHVFRVERYFGAPLAFERGTAVAWASAKTIGRYRLTPGTVRTLALLGEDTFR